MSDRITQRQIISQTLRGNTIANQINQSAVATASVSLSNGDAAVFSFTTNAVKPNRQQLQTFVVYDISIYINQISDDDDLLADENHNPAEWQVVDVGNSWGLTNNLDTRRRIYIRNISAGSNQLVIVRQRARLLVGNANSVVI
jgi:hypothetical protein